MARVNGQAYRRVKETFRTQSQSANTPCWICLQPIDYDAASDDWGNDDRFQPDHYYPVSTHPQLENDPANLRASHAGCNRDRSNGTPRPPVDRQSRNWLTPK